MRRILNIAFILAMASVCALGFQSCVYDDLDGPDSGRKAAVMLLDISPVGTTRAGTVDIELMHSLRLIIVDESGSVEHNRHIILNNGSQRYIYRCEITTGHKKVYIIANEESISGLTTLLDGMETGSKEVESKLNSYVFTPDYSKNIPMSSMYEVDIVKGNNEKEFNIVRVATKFDVTIDNKRSDNVKLEKFTINGLTEKSYLLPVFSSEDAGIFVKVNESIGEKKPFVFNNDFSFNAGDKVLHWADWLKLASDESNNSPRDEELADKRGWIMEYSIPSEDHKEIQWEEKDLDIISSNKQLSLPTHYYPESRLLKPVSTFAPDLEQEYEFTIEFSSPDEKWENKQFNQVFPNLRALFRNTHVLLNITLTDTGVKWRIFVRPWYLREQPEIIM